MKRFIRTTIFGGSFVLFSFFLAGQVHGTDSAPAVTNWIPFDWFTSIEERQLLMERLEPKPDKKRSFIDLLHYRLLTEGSATLAVIGSSVTKGSGATTYTFSWAGRLESKLKRINWDFKRLQVVNLGFSGFSSRDLLIQGKAEKLVASDPDLIIFETSILNDHTKSVPIPDTLRSIEQIVSLVKQEVPNAVIVLTSPNPSTRKRNKRNALGLTYQDYLNETGALIHTKGWHYIDIYSKMEEARKKMGIPLDAILSDNLHPNDIGYQLWFRALWDGLKEEVEGL